MGSLGMCRLIEGIGVFNVSICEFIMVLLGSLGICVFIMGSCGFTVGSLWIFVIHCGIVGFTVSIYVFIVGICVFIVVLLGSLWIFWVDCGYLWEIQLFHHLLYLCFTVIILLVWTAILFYRILQFLNHTIIIKANVLLPQI